MRASLANVDFIWIDSVEDWPLNFSDWRESFRLSLAFGNLSQVCSVAKEVLLLSLERWNFTFELVLVVGAHRFDFIEHWLNSIDGSVADSVTRLSCALYHIQLFVHFLHVIHFNCDEFIWQLDSVWLDVIGHLFTWARHFCLSRDKL